VSDPHGARGSPAFVVATYNVLANAYIRRDWYPRTPPRLLLPEERVPAVARRLRALGADLLCLQEVERSTFATYAAHLALAGYNGRHAQRPDGRPDGCVIFLRGPMSAWRSHVVIDLDDDGAPRRTRRIAQMACVDVGGRRLGIVNAHLEWDAPDTPADLQIAPRQVARLLAARAPVDDCAGWIVCGDFNATPESPAVHAIRSAGLTASHGDRPPPTCNANRHARAIDYLFHDAALVASPRAMRPLAADAPLPGPDEPSDHLPVVAAFSWA
jgi:mRNA deadenylase 3'-5' endonuclease subunit Ccr4